MIPILYETDETDFLSNGLGRLRDCISCVVTEERNGIYECDFEYPMDGAHFDDIRIGRIVGVTHGETGDIQPFDIVSYSRPIEGIVEFHCTHVSYRQSYITVTGTGINSLADTFTWLSQSEPANPFTYWTDKTSTGYLGASNGIPHSVRQVLGGMQGSILDAYGGEYEWDKWSVKLYSARGEARNFSIRYGVNMLDYNEEYEIAGTYSSCIPYWTDGTSVVVGNRVDAPSSTPTGRGECVPLDLSDKFETEPTQSQVEVMAQSYMANNEPYIPRQSIEVEFVRIQDLAGFEEYERLLECNLCDTINVIFPDYNSSGQFKIVRTVWDVLKGRYESMELGHLSTTLAEALGISSDTSESKFNQSGFNKAANAFEVALSAKNPLTVSDYIRVVGSDNVSYKNLVSNVASVIVKNAYLTPPIALSNGADILSLDIGVYYTPSNDVAASLVNRPSGLSFNCRVEVLSRIPARKEIIITDSANNVWENQMNSASTWTGWIQRPTRAEVNALSVPETGTLTSSHTLVSGQCVLEKVGKVCYLTVGITTTSAVSSYGVLASIPSGFRPVSQFWGRSLQDKRVNVTASGSLLAIDTMASGEIVNFSCSYIIA